MADLQAIVDAVYAASAVGDFDTVESHLTDDFVVEEADSLPFAGIYKGKSALRDLFPVVMGMMGVTGLERACNMVGETAVSSVVRLKFEKADDVEMLEVFHFKGDKICEIRPYYFDVNKVKAACEAHKAA